MVPVVPPPEPEPLAFFPDEQRIIPCEFAARMQALSPDARNIRQDDLRAQAHGPYRFLFFLDRGLPSPSGLHSLGPQSSLKPRSMLYALPTEPQPDRKHI